MAENVRNVPVGVGFEQSVPISSMGPSRTNGLFLHRETEARFSKEYFENMGTHSSLTLTFTLPLCSKPSLASVEDLV